MDTFADRPRRARCAGCAPALAFSGTLVGQAGPGRGVALPGPLPLLPPDSWWNVDVRGAPLEPGNSRDIAFIDGSPNLTPTLHPDFGGDALPSPAIYGMVFVTVPGDRPLESIAFDDADQSGPGAPGRPVRLPSQSTTTRPQARFT